MAEGKDILQSLQRRWMVQGLIFCGLLSVAVTLLLMIALAWWGYGSLWWGAGLLVLSIVVLLLVFPSWRITITDTARVLDKHLPELEESSHLLLKRDDELGALERLQAVRIGRRLDGLRLPHPLRRRLMVGAGVLGAVILLRMNIGFEKAVVPVVRQMRVEVPKPIPGVRAIHIRVTPPAYTGRAIRDQQDLNLQVEEGAVVNWEIQTNVAVDTMQFIFSDKIGRAHV